VSERRTALAPYVHHLAQICEPPAESVDAAHPAVVPSLDLDGWERKALGRALEATAGAQDAWETLLAEGVAVQSKFLAETSCLQGDQPLPPDMWEKLRNQMTQTAAIGLALMEEIQRVVDAMILGGDMGQAKKLTGFRNKIGQVVSQAKEQVGTKAYEHAEALAAEMVMPLEQQPQAKRRLEEPDEGPPQQIKLNRHAGAPLGTILEAKEARSRIRPLATVFVVALAAWCILVAPRFFRAELPVLTPQDLPLPPEVQEVIARPPSLFLVVDGAAWGRMPRESREALVQQVGRIAEEAGYVGVQFRNAKGTSVARWSLARGASLIEPTKAKS
jgi:hypothetical protein